MVILKTPLVFAALILFLGSLRTEKIIEETKYLSLPKCEPWDGGDYWCEPYVDWGYANGLVMAKRIVAEKEMVKSLPGSQKDGWTPLDLEECRQIIDDLYEIGHPTASGNYPFRTK